MISQYINCATLNNNPIHAYINKSFVYASTGIFGLHMKYPASQKAHSKSEDVTTSFLRISFYSYYDARIE